jgi:rfaE bifunctional protein nucleotidyltransferase chain/domain
MNRFQYIQDKLLTDDRAIQKSLLWKLKGEKVVFTNGCFDILHPGHVTYLAQAASLGNKLIVGLNSDDSVRSLNKDANRPINNEEARALVLAALGFVDAVVVFNDKTPQELIQKISPDVLVKGGDYDANEEDKNSKRYIVGSSFVQSYGGLVQTIDLVDGFSTTSLIAKMK